MDQGLKRMASGSSDSCFVPCKSKALCSENRSLLPCETIDRISSLPDEMLSRIFIFLPTKDAAAMRVVSRKMKSVFPWRTSVTLDDTPISHCEKAPHLKEGSPTFIKFVDSVIQALSSCHAQQNLRRFRLRFGQNTTKGRETIPGHECGENCLPGMKSTHVNSWICFPLMSNSIRHLELCIHVKKPRVLPAALFTCETLMVLKLDVNLKADQVPTTQPFRLPKLRTLQLRSVYIRKDNFVTSLVSSCPSLEYLDLECWWRHGDFITISSPSLRRLSLKVLRRNKFKSSDTLLIDTPNLQRFYCNDNLAYRYITNVSAVVTAQLNIFSDLLNDAHNVSFWSMVGLVRALSNVQHLSLIGMCMKALDLDQLKDQLPLFRKLNHLELGYSKYGPTKWNNVLLVFLDRSPSLEKLVFAQGLAKRNYVDEMQAEAITELERQFYRTSQAIPSCCRSHLKKIVINRYRGSEREVELVNYLLRIGLVLEELVICWGKKLSVNVDQCLHGSMLQKLPRASNNCSIEVR